MSNSIFPAEKGTQLKPDRLFQEAFPWFSDLLRHISKLRSPALHGKRAYIASDYGGEHPESDYSVISLLWASFDTLGTWEKERQLLRKRFLKDGRRMAFKNLNERQRQRAPKPFLRAANQIDGVCVTLSVRKSIKYLCTTKGLPEGLRDDIGLQGRWKPDDFEKLSRIALMVSGLTSALSNPGQDICWVSDEDALFANHKRQLDVSRMLKAFSMLLVPHTPGVLSFGTTQMDPGDRREEDLASIPDLAAGAAAEAVTAVARTCGGRVPSVHVNIPQGLSWKSEESTIGSSSQAID